MRNLVRYGLISLIIITALVVARSSGAGELTVAWDPNTEETLKGYNIYYGPSSRLAEDANAAYEKWCLEKKPDDPKCVENWAAYCERNNALGEACDIEVFKGYTQVINVGNVTQYTLTGLTEGATYHLAATAYSEKGYESAFSKELVHTVNFFNPGIADQLKKKHWLRW